MYNKDSLDTLCGALAYAMGVEAPKQAAEKNALLSEFVDRAFGGARADRIAKRAKVKELSADPVFSEFYMMGMLFPN